MTTLLLFVALALAQPQVLPTQPANPGFGNDVWIWVEQPTGPVYGTSLTITFWAFKCNGTVTKVQPWVTALGGKISTPAVVGPLPRPDIQAAMASKCSSGVPLNIGYKITFDLTRLPRTFPGSNQRAGYLLDLEVTDHTGHKTMARESTGTWWPQ